MTIITILVMKLTTAMQLMLTMKMKVITMVINKDNIESRLGDVLSKCPGGANNGFDHNFVMANTEAPLNFVCRVSRS